MTDAGWALDVKHYSKITFGFLKKEKKYIFILSFSFRLFIKLKYKECLMQETKLNGIKLITYCCMLFFKINFTYFPQVFVYVTFIKRNLLCLPF